MSSLQTSNTSAKLLYVGFNQNHECFACGTSSGFIVFNSDLGKVLYRRELGGGIGFVAMLFRTNIIALIGGGTNPYYPTNKVIIWDDRQSRVIGELSFKTNVLSVKLRRDKVVVLIKDKIYIYNFHDLKLIDHMIINNNMSTQCAISYKRPTISSKPRTLMETYDASTCFVLAAPALKENEKNQIQILVYSENQIKGIMLNSYSSNNENLSKTMGLFEMSFDGELLAVYTMFDEFSTICVYDVFSAEMIHEIQHKQYNINNAKVTSLAFSPRKSYLAYSVSISIALEDCKIICMHWNDGVVVLDEITDLIHTFHGTKSSVYVEKIKNETDETIKLIESNLFGALQTLQSLKNSISEKYGHTLQNDMVVSMESNSDYDTAFAWFHVRDNRCIVSFSELEQCIIVISDDGNYYNASLNCSDGAQCTLSNHVLLQ